MVWPVKTHPAQSTGPEGKKNSGDGENFSLDFSFYRTSTITACLVHKSAFLDTSVAETFPVDERRIARNP